MECQKRINLLDNENIQAYRFRKKNWGEISDDGYGTNNTKSIKFNTAILKSSPCYYSYIYILVKGTITVVS